jgi:dihydrofolate synthase/folylpolyglutamate synthase
MSYTAAVDHLHALGLELSTTRRKFELDHMRVLARALGDPQTRFPSILIAGTNGKGSTAATLASILAAAGLRTGLYTSPHLTRVTERIRVSTPLPRTSNLEPGTWLAEIPEPDFARLYFQVDDAARALVTGGKLPHHPSFFESLTALAFLYFAEQQVDIAVLEVGLGGRLDATNIVEPILSVITDIALDHQDYLGNTIAEIAREKAGILRANGTLITLPQHPEANQAIGEAAIALNVRAINAAQYLPGRDALEPRSSKLEPAPLRPNHYDLHLDGETLHIRSPLAGQHQQRNIALAIAAAIEVLTSNLEPRTSNLSEAIESGIAATAWPGRLEFLPPNMILDVAHNPAGAWTLRAAIASLPEEQPRTLLFSCLKDKDLREMAQILFPLFDSTCDRPHDHIVLCPIDSPRAASLEALLAAADALSIPAHPAESPTEALALARQLTPENGLILATGSIYLIGAIRDAASNA